MMASYGNTTSGSVDDRFSPSAFSGLHTVDIQEQRKWRKRIALVGILFVIGILIVLIVSVTVPVTIPPTVRFPVSSSKLKHFNSAAAAADADQCSSIAREIMENQGGTAVDGAIAAAICTGTINMYCAGIGGGFFMTIWNNTQQKAYVLDARETAPLTASENMFSSNNGISSTTGPFAIAVPGEVAGYWKLWTSFGQVPWKTLFEPTIKLCRDGFKVTKGQGYGIADIISRVNKMKDPKPFAYLMQYLFNDQTGQYLKEGDTMYCEKLAVTLQRIADLGGPEFYSGALADDILADLAEAGSLINQTDFLSYEPILHDNPLDMKIQGDKYRLISTRPPGGGAILGFTLNILAGYNFKHTSSQELVSYHRFVEAMKFGYGQRMLLGDEAFVPSILGLVGNLTSATWAEAFRARIDDSRTFPVEYYLPASMALTKDDGTSHISVVDQYGNAAAITTTINSKFGSGVMGGRTGIIFNDEMDDFSKPNETNSWNLPPSVNNFVAPGKRPQSSTCPSLIFTKGDDGQFNELALVVGGSGGSAILSGTSYVALRILYFQENPKQAIDALRLHDQLIPVELQYEQGMPENLLHDLKKRGHVNETVFSDDGFLSIIQAIQIAADGKKLAFSDYRKLAHADGF